MQFNEVFFFIIGFFSFVYGKKIEFGRPKGARQLNRATEGSPKVGGLGVSPKESPRAKGEHHNRKAKAQTPGLKRKTSLTTKETKGAQTNHQERADPPMQGKGTRTARARAHHSLESPEPQETKERKANPRTGEPQPLPPRATTQKEQDNNKASPEGAQLKNDKQIKGVFK